MMATRQVRMATHRSPNIQIDDSQKGWLDHLRANPELETTTVLFAKSISELARKPTNAATRFISQLQRPIIVFLELPATRKLKQTADR